MQSHVLQGFITITNIQLLLSSLKCNFIAHPFTLYANGGANFFQRQFRLVIVIVLDEMCFTENKNNATYPWSYFLK